MIISGSKYFHETTMDALALTHILIPKREASCADVIHAISGLKAYAGKHFRYEEDLCNQPGIIWRQ